ncbi:hypothetical protein V5799_006806 [Amblyomma americanum]|uniref:Uncharacterized protein n=1 Tax=Amblyomma americanum TaxID=6943 RepID=A0AAQ4DVC3_AMBAM
MCSDKNVARRLHGPTPHDPAMRMTPARHARRRGKGWMVSSRRSQLTPSFLESCNWVRDLATWLRGTRRQRNDGM